MSDPRHRQEIRIYYEDTDAGGIVYHAAYLRFAERGRTELLRARGFTNTSLRERFGILFVVRDLQAVYKAPAVLDDLLTLETRVTRTRRAALVMDQEIFRDRSLLFSLRVTLACVDNKLRPVRIPEDVRGAFMV